MIERAARIVWLTAEQGGRKAPPTGPRFIVPARFDAAKHRWPNEQWSLVLNLVTLSPDSMEWIANVRFLVDEAPHEFLSDGARFELYEGAKCVAIGTILQTSLDSGKPAQLLAAHELVR